MLDKDKDKMFIITKVRKIFSLEHVSPFSHRNIGGEFVALINLYVIKNIISSNQTL